MTNTFTNHEIGTIKATHIDLRSVGLTLQHVDDKNEDYFISRTHSTYEVINDDGIRFSTVFKSHDFEECYTVLNQLVTSKHYSVK